MTSVFETEGRYRGQIDDEQPRRASTGAQIPNNHLGPEADKPLAKSTRYVDI